MGLLDRLLKGGSPLTPYNGETPPTNPLSTQQSQLHSYSISGQFFSNVNDAYQSYLDGVNNILPQPSQLDLNGITPPKYTDNLPN